MGLRNDEWLDERRDFWKSTEAALRKLREDRERFGDWSLALAAYNCGSGCIARIISASGVRDFWQLRDKGLLPPETAEYVPAFFALARICSSPQRYGLSGDWRRAPQWERVELRQSVDLELLAEALEVNPETLRETNAELKTPITPPDERGYLLKVPAGLGTRVEQLLADPQTPLLRYRYHRLRSGDTLYGLARSYRVHLGLLEQANPGLEPHRLAIGTLLRVPVAGEESAAPGTAGEQALAPAGAPGLSPAAVPAAASAGQAGLASRPADPGAETIEFTAGYTIVAGDTLWSIARRYGVTPERLAEANSRALDGLLKPGETLRVPGSGGAQ
jgi:membrane-bound lytic murein transglycosylase D